MCCVAPGHCLRVNPTWMWGSSSYFCLQRQKGTPASFTVPQYLSPSLLQHKGRSSTLFGLSPLSLQGCECRQGAEPSCSFGALGMEARGLHRARGETPTWGQQWGLGVASGAALALPLPRFPPQQPPRSTELGAIPPSQPLMPQPLPPLGPAWGEAPGTPKETPQGRPNPSPRAAGSGGP